MKTDEYFFRVDRLSSQPFCIVMRQQESETLQAVLEVAYQTQENVSSGYPHIEKGVENTTRTGVFLTKLEVFVSPMKHCLECLRSKRRRKIVKIYDLRPGIQTSITVGIVFILT